MGNTVSKKNLFLQYFPYFSFIIQGAFKDLCKLFLYKAVDRLERNLYLIQFLILTVKSKFWGFQIHANHNIYNLNNQKNQQQIPFDYTPDIISKPY